MKSRYLLRPKAVQELADYAHYLTSEATAEIGHQFLVAAHRTFANLATHPEMGWRLRSGKPSLRTLRVFRVSGFEKMLVLYQPVESGVEIVRVIHGSRNVLALLHG